MNSQPASDYNSSTIQSQQSVEGSEAVTNYAKHPEKSAGRLLISVDHEFACLSRPALKDGAEFPSLSPVLERRAIKIVIY